MNRQRNHFYWPDSELGMPEDIKQRMHDDGYRGAICGYMRKNTVKKECNVSCFYCLKQIEKLVK